MMKIAIPTANGLMCPHFGHCEKFALIDIDPETKQISGRADVVPPPHEPGVLPAWLAEQGVQVIIAGGMGGRAMALFNEKGIDVVVGAPAESPERLAVDFTAGTLKTSGNVCDH